MTDQMSRSQTNSIFIIPPSMTGSGWRSTPFFVNLQNSHNLLVVRYLRRLEVRKSLIVKDLQNNWGTKKCTHEHECKITLFNTIIFVIDVFVICIPLSLSIYLYKGGIRLFFRFYFHELQTFFNPWQSTSYEAGWQNFVSRWYATGYEASITIYV